jgi:HSP20 family protein
MAKEMASLMEAARIQSEINRLFDNLLDLDGGKHGAWLPNADIVETEDTLVVNIELPGVRAESLTLSVLAGNVILRGEKQRPGVSAEAHSHTAERQYGPFRRSIHLGVPVNTRQARALLQNGLLRLTFPKVPNRRGEEVPVEVESA